ncbi:hypothetical protein N7449_009224 [Penicillium cf. viridicatum]|uniref:Uncharacterized protein n=1 Tax=Penicillium cf. viridicatum TaxID=2972119 RepID=A0A9W9JB94_9EURO|nr:hypothetical protein N7449_009224 [Penicillium cf. viridicatum]
MIPGTFTSLQKSKSLEYKLDTNDIGKTILYTIQNPPILSIRYSFLILGTLVINIYTTRNRYWPIIAVLTYTNLAN